MSKEFYKNRHVTEEARQDTLKFLALQDECDRHNIEVYESMCHESMKKGAIKSFIASTKPKPLLAKKIAREALSPYGRDRSWIK